jgi:hypothetical protein
MSETLTFYSDEIAKGESVQEVHVAITKDGAKQDVRNHFESMAFQNPEFVRELQSNVKHDMIGLLGFTSLLKNVGFSASFGYPWVGSMDMTIRLPYHVYTTHRLSLPGNWENIVQKRLIRTRLFALNLGYSVRFDSYDYKYTYDYDKSNCYLCVARQYESFRGDYLSHGPRISLSSNHIYANVHYTAYSDHSPGAVFFTVSKSFKLRKD